VAARTAAAAVPAMTTPCGWRAELGLRFRELFWLKLVGTTLWTWLFFVGYFHLLRRPGLEPFVLPLTVLDRLVPFQPVMLWPYLSLWLYVGVAPGLQRGLGELLAYGVWVGALLLAGLALFYVWPTAIPPHGLDRAVHPGFAMVEGVDANGNACPSMHVAIAVFTAVRLRALLNEVGAPWPLALANLGWCALIAWSTLAVRQHVLVDVLAGAALGLAFAWPSLRWRPARWRRRYHRPATTDRYP